MIRTVCPHCQTPVSFSDHLAGLTLPCPECRVPLGVPQPADITTDLPPEVPEPIPAPPLPDPGLTRIRPRPWRLVVFLAVVLLLVAGLAWWMEGSWAWEVSSGVAAVLLVLVLLYSVWLMIRRPLREMASLPGA